MSSQNKNQYVTFEYENLSEAGLRRFIQSINRNSTRVASVTASNKSRKRDGVSTKTVNIFFEAGQRAVLTIGEGGDLVSVAINGLSVPIKTVKNRAQLAKEISNMIKKGQEKFDRSIQKKLKAVKPVSQLSPASKGVKAQILEAEKELELIKNNEFIIKSNLDDLLNQVAQKTLAIETTEQEIEKEKAKTIRLKARLAELG